jgi:hypothetical protein
MKNKLSFCALALLILGGVSVPAQAGKVYIPLVDRSAAGSTHATEILIANHGAQARRYSTTFLAAGTDGTVRGAASPRVAVAAGRTNRLTGSTTSGRFGLLEIDTAPQLLIDARLNNVPASSPASASASPVPAISSANALAANTVAHLLGLNRDGGGSTDVGIVNLASQNAQCTIGFIRADGTAIGTAATVTIVPLSLRHFGDPLGLLGETQAADARAVVTCDRQFFAYAAVFNPASLDLVFRTPSAIGTSSLGGTAPPPTGGTPVVFTLDGQIHMPTRGNESKDLLVPLDRQLTLKRMIIEWDVTPGPFTPGFQDRNHSLIWVYRGVYRSNTIANVNCFGPPRSEVKNTTNVDIAPPNLSAKETPMVFQEGVLYRLRYVYDAELRKSTTTVSTGGTVVASMEQSTTGASNSLVVKAPGVNVHFGHTAAQALEGIEFPTYGWRYGNLRVEMVPY